MTAINGTMITVKADDGTTTTVALGTNTQIQRPQEITLADVKAGDQVRATGSQSGDVFEATALLVGGGAIGGVRP